MATKEMVKTKSQTLRPSMDFAGRQVRAEDTNYSKFDKRPASFTNGGVMSKANRTDENSQQ
jgi:hypothetical protein